MAINSPLVSSNRDREKQTKGELGSILTSLGTEGFLTLHLDLAIIQPRRNYIIPENRVHGILTSVWIY